MYFYNKFQFFLLKINQIVIIFTKHEFILFKKCWITHDFHLTDNFIKSITNLFKFNY